MKKIIKIRKLSEGFQPWIIIGAMAVLFPIFAFMTMENLNRQKENSYRFLVEKGAALIRSFEAGTRTGMMSRQWKNFKLERLLSETAKQPDIDYILVADAAGTIVAHDDPVWTGKHHGNGLDLKKVTAAETVRWRIIKDSEDTVFEVYKKFLPAGPPVRKWHDRRPPKEDHQGFNHTRIRTYMGFKDTDKPVDLIIFVGLKMDSVEAARTADTRHTIIMAGIMLFIGLVGIMLLFLAQGYRAARSALTRVKAFSDKLVDNMPMGLVALDSEKKTVAVNHAAEEILGVVLEKNAGKRAEKILPHDLLEIVKGLSDKLEVSEKEIDCRLKNGTTVPMEVSAAMFYGAEDGFLGYVILFKDLSEIRSLRKEVLRNQRLASVGMLAAGVAHEIRNPLSSIKGFATWFRERYADKDEELEIAEIMISEVDRLNRVVGQLLEFSVPVSLTKGVFSLKKFIEDSLKLIKNRAKEKEIRISRKFSDEAQVGFFDPDKINQVLLNLYLNAIESMESGGELTVNVSSGDSITNITICDTGRGIGKEAMSKMFDPYFTTKPAGTGLGLSIVHNIVEAHGGSIQVESDTGKGTSITLSLPAKR